MAFGLLIYKALGKKSEYAFINEEVNGSGKYMK